MYNEASAKPSGPPTRPCRAIVGQFSGKHHPTIEVPPKFEPLEKIKHLSDIVHVLFWDTAKEASEVLAPQRFP
jgi:hypothetical protein